MTAQFSRAFDWARTQVTEGRLPTAVLGIATADGTVALDAFGSTGPRTAKTDDHYRLFSITKPLTGLTAARAIERGLLSPETPLSAALAAARSLGRSASGSSRAEWAFTTTSPSRKTRTSVRVGCHTGVPVPPYAAAMPASLAGASALTSQARARSLSAPLTSL